MLILGDQIRLNAEEYKTLHILIGASAGPIRTRSQLQAIVEGHMALYQGSSPEERLLCRLLEQFLPTD